MARRARDVVELGQRFKHNSLVWEVVRVRSVHGIPHAVIVNVRDRTEDKLISVSTLVEGSDFTQE